MGDSKDKPKKQKDKKPAPFRNGLIVGLLVGGFIGLLINTPPFMQPIKDPIANVFNSAQSEARNTAADGLKGTGKVFDDASEKVKEDDDKGQTP